MLVYNYTTEDGVLCHYGIPGMKWGRRKARMPSTTMGRYRSAYKSQVQSAKASYKKQKQAYKQTDEYKQQRKVKAKKAAVAGSAVAAAALATYGAYKLNKFVKAKNMDIAYERGHKAVQKSIDSSQRLLENSKKMGSVSGSYKINPDAIIDSHLNSARNDSFAKAAKNVINYRKTGGNTGFRYTGATEAAFRRKF